MGDRRIAKEHAFEQELAAYEKQKKTLLAGSEGKYALVIGDAIEGVWGTYEDALQQGYKLRGLEPFLVKKIENPEIVHFFTRDLTGCRS